MLHSQYRSAIPPTPKGRGFPRDFFMIQERIQEILTLTHQLVERIGERIRDRVSGANPDPIHPAKPTLDSWSAMIFQQTGPSRGAPLTVSNKVDPTRLND